MGAIGGALYFPHDWTFVIILAPGKFQKKLTPTPELQYWILTYLICAINVQDLENLTIEQLDALINAEEAEDGGKFPIIFFFWSRII